MLSRRRCFWCGRVLSDCSVRAASCCGIRAVFAFEIGGETRERECVGLNQWENGQAGASLLMVSPHEWSCDLCMVGAAAGRRVAGMPAQIAGSEESRRSRKQQLDRDHNAPSTLFCPSKLPARNYPRISRTLQTLFLRLMHPSLSSIKNTTTPDTIVEGNWVQREEQPNAGKVTECYYTGTS